MTKKERLTYLWLWRIGFAVMAVLVLKAWGLI